jgi:hypothetical protein
MDIDATLLFARSLLGDPEGLWKRANPEQRPRIQRAIYPNGLRYDGELNGTAETSLAFSYSREIQAGKEGMASQSHSSWNRTWEWLREIDGLRPSSTERHATPSDLLGGDLSA